MINLSYEEAKYRDFSEFKELTGTSIEYNGKVYFISKDDNIITQGKTNEEIYSFIAGYMKSYKELYVEIFDLQNTIKELQNTNDTLTKTYENMLNNRSIDGINTNSEIVSLDEVDTELDKVAKELLENKDT